jgi:excisionase family DNA binding protein
MTSRTQLPSDRGTKAAAFGQVRGRRHSGSGLPKYYAIRTVAESLDVSTRTVRRWIANGDLIVHRIDGVVRIVEGDLRAFLAVHREAAPGRVLVPGSARLLSPILLPANA